MAKARRFDCASRRATSASVVTASRTANCGRTLIPSARSTISDLDFRQCFDNFACRPTQKFLHRGSRFKSLHLISRLQCRPVQHSRFWNRAVKEIQSIDRTGTQRSAEQCAGTSVWLSGNVQKGANCLRGNLEFLRYLHSLIPENDSLS